MREAEGTTIKASKRMADESSKPSKQSSVENEHSQHKLASIEIEVHRDGKDVTGHTVTHRYHSQPSKSGAFSSYEEPKKYVFDGDGHSSTHGHLSDHMAEHMPHLFSADKGAIEAENKGGQGDDNKEEEYV